MNNNLVDINKENESQEIKSILTGVTYRNYKKGTQIDNGKIVDTIFSKSSKHIIYTLEGSKRICYEYEFSSHETQNHLNSLSILILRAEDKFKNTAADDITKRAIPIFDLIFRENTEKISFYLAALDEYINQREVVKEIIGFSDKYVIWINSKNETDFIYWAPRNNLNTAMAEYFRLRALGLSFIPDGLRKKFSFQLGAALAEVFETSKNTISIFKESEALISKTIENSLRTKYTGATTATAILAILTSLFAVNYFNFSSLTIASIYTTVGGIIGAFISIQERAKSIKCQIHDPIETIVFQAFVRMMLGGIFGFISFIASQMGVAFGVFKDNIIGLVLIGIAAGFSERLIPEILQTITKEKSPKAQASA